MASRPRDSHDFIVVGAGPGGSQVATRLANSKKRPSVLLVEAGGKNDSRADRIDGERFLHLMDPAKTWGYKTAPQANLDDLVIAYDRGKGLGGSSAINYACWTRGSSDEYDMIADTVGGQEWDWAHAREIYKRLESYSEDTTKISPAYQKYLKPRAEDRGNKKPVKVGVPLVWEKSMTDDIDVWIKNGSTLNRDNNSGDPLGVSVGYATANRGNRSSAADSLLNAPPNLKIVTDTQVARVIFDGNKATGIEALNGKRYVASKEVILAAGALDTPRVLLHSGIGPENQLAQWGIPLVKGNSNVGLHLKDHHHIAPAWTRAEHTSERQKYYRSKELQAAARKQWEKDGSGPLSEYACGFGMLFEKIDKVFQTPEFKNLPEEAKKHLLKPTVPSYEFIFNGPVLGHFMDPDNAVAGTSAFIILLNLQSSGEVYLQSKDPSVPLLFNPNFFSHPYDRRLAIEATRHALKVTSGPDFSKNTVSILAGPKDDSEEEILDYWRKNTCSTWHMASTARMGKTEKDAVVDRNLRVFGVKNLRIADMSVVPLAPSCHTQTFAYWVGLTLGDKLVKEYALDA